MDADNWGEQQTDRPVFSKPAIILAVIASQLLPLSLPWFVLAAAGDSEASLAVKLLAIPMGLFLLAGPYVVVLLSYLMLYYLPRGSVVRGRLLVWIALACGYAGSMWSLMLLNVVPAASTTPIAVMTAIVFLVHLAIFASESTGARYLSVALLLVFAAAAVLAPALVHSRRQARTMHALSNLKDTALGYLDMEYVGRPRQDDLEMLRETDSPEDALDE